MDVGVALPVYGAGATRILHLWACASKERYGQVLGYCPFVRGKVQRGTRGGAIGYGVFTLAVGDEVVYIALCV